MSGRGNKGKSKGGRGSGKKMFVANIEELQMREGQVDDARAAQLRRRAEADCDAPKEKKSAAGGGEEDDDSEEEGAEEGAKGGGGVSFDRGESGGGAAAGGTKGGGGDVFRFGGMKKAAAAAEEEEDEEEEDRPKGLLGGMKVRACALLFGARFFKFD